MLVISLFLSVYIRQREIAAKLFVLLGLFFGLDGIDTFPLASGPYLYSITVLAKVFIIPTLMHFAVVFPRKDLTLELYSNNWKRRLTLSLYIFSALLAPWMIPFFLNGSTILERKNELLEIVFWGFIGLLFGLALLTSVIFSIGLILSNYRRIRQSRNDLEKKINQGFVTDTDSEYKSFELLNVAVQQFKWLFWGMRILLIGTIFLFILFVPFPIFSLSGWIDAVMQLVFLSLFVCVAVAILNYRLWDVDLLFFRSLIFVTLLILFSAFFETELERLINFIFPTIQKIASWLVGFISTFLVGVLAYLLEGPIESFIDRRFLGNLLSYHQKTIDLKKTIKDAGNVEKLIEILTEIVPARLGYSGAWVQIPLRSDPQEAKRKLERQGAVKIINLASNNRIVGVYGLGAKTWEVNFNITWIRNKFEHMILTEEEKLLKDLSKTAAKRFIELEAAGLERISVLIISNTKDKTVSRLLAEALEDKHRVVGVFTSKEAIKIAETNQIDVLLLDVGATRQLRWKNTIQKLKMPLPGIKVVVLVDEPNQFSLEQIQQAGAQGCTKKSNLDELYSAIRSVHEGKYWYHGKVYETDL